MSNSKPVNWFDIQESVFTRWMNDELKTRGLHCNAMKTDLADGVLLVNLMENISGKSLGRYNKHPRLISQKNENLNIALKFIQDSGVKLVNIGADDIGSGNLRIILGLIWSLILFWEIKRGGQEDDDLLKWVQSKIPDYGITGWKKDWNDGRAVCALVNALRPGYCPDHKGLNPDDAVANCDKGISIAEQRMGVDRLILPEEMAHPKVDKLAMQCYIAQFRNIKDEEIEINKAHLVKCYGDGLVEGIQNEEAQFMVETDKAGPGKLDIKVFGPEGDDSPVMVTPRENGSYTVDYTPTVPGEYQIHVTFDGQHVPGSVFTVVVLEQMSIGGEGKIIAFYTSTSSNKKFKSDFYILQKLFEGKKVHLREDFEPWTPVDLMTREDRNAIFKKAGTRDLPICFIDDEYAGSVDHIVELEEQGKLDALLNMNGRSCISQAEHLARLKEM